MNNENISKNVGVHVPTVLNIRKSWLESRDIEQVLERKPKDLEDARKVRSKELILQLPESH